MEIKIVKLGRSTKLWLLSSPGLLCSIAQGKTATWTSDELTSACVQESPQAVVHSPAAVAALQGLPAIAKLTLRPPQAKQPPPLMQTVAPSAVLLSSHPSSSLTGKRKTHGRPHHQRQRSLTVMTHMSGGQGSSSRSRADHLTRARIRLMQLLRTQQLI